MNMRALPPSSTSHPLRPIGAWLAAGLPPCGSAHGAQANETEADADPVATHLERGLAFLEQGEHAKALLEFEQVLRFDNVPADLSHGVYRVDGTGAPVFR